MSSKILIKRGLETNRAAIAPDAGELILTTDTNKLFFGNGAVSGGIHFTASLSEVALQANTASYVNFTNVALSGSGIVSGSAQTVANLQGSNINSGSAQTVASLVGQTVSLTTFTASNIQVTN